MERRSQWSSTSPTSSSASPTRVPDREAVVVRRPPAAPTRELDERATRLAHALARAAASAPATTSGCYLRNSRRAPRGDARLLQAARGPDQRQLPLRRRRARATCSPTPTSSRSFHDAERATGADGRGATSPDGRDVVLDVAGARRTTAELAAGVGRRATSARAPPTTTTCSTRAARPACPKGVVWRQEDIFFAALGGGNPGGPPIDRARGDRARSVLDNPRAAARGRSCRPATRGPTQFVSLALGPLMHASGQWSALGTLLGGGKVVLYDRAARRHGARARPRRARARRRMLNLVGDASARPLLADARRAARALGHVVAAAARLGRQHPVGRREGRGCSPRSRRCSRSSKASARRSRPRRRSRSRTRDGRAVGVAALRGQGRDDGRRRRRCARSRPGSGSRRPARDDAAACRSATTTIPERSARTFVEIDGARWSLPGDMATIDADGTVHLLGRGSLCINTGGEKVYPEEVEAVLKTPPRRRRRGRRRRARRPLRPAGRRGRRRPRAGRAPDARRRCRRTAAPTSPATRCRASLHVVDEVRRSPAGKADYTWAAAVVEGAAAT